MMDIESPQNSAEEARHPIQVVSRRTGLSADVIRVWERRYGVVSPTRVSGGRRLYTDSDIKRLALLQKVTSAGRRISEVSELDDEALGGLVQEDESSITDLLVSPTGAQGPAGHVEKCFQALRSLDQALLRCTLAVAEAELSLPVFLDQVVSVFLKQIGQAWEKGTVRVSQEHMTSVIVRHHLLGMLKGLNKSGPVMILTTPTGQDHEMGALMAAIIAESEGWNAIYLGPNLPAVEIAAIAIQSNASAVGLSLQCISDEALLSDELRQIKMILPEEMPVIVGGAAVDHYRSMISEFTENIPNDLEEFRVILSRIIG
ncbi:MerR family transcriptional regulator [Solemya velesiana gill symbiont]|uniref:HTH merR-type domain-containing protein n=1 Tax=Solemya velesiana gill symbiont TaxID=1918948 RepID=A0A1T2KVS7_9GAMM|nr:MerR family transcriptional regulator [Solemya velesiana gill symbiont]OOZ36912.1 hypothetical protein BOW51_05105 [Solemya velesiana gill symbiont]